MRNNKNIISNGARIQTLGKLKLSITRSSLLLVPILTWVIATATCANARDVWRDGGGTRLDWGQISALGANTFDSMGAHIVLPMAPVHRASLEVFTPQGRRARRNLLRPFAGWQTRRQSRRGQSVDHLQAALVEGVGDRVFFANGSTELNRNARAILRKQAGWLELKPYARVRLNGHADDLGGNSRNERLAWQRAEVVRNRLIRYGVLPRRITIRALGRRRPVAICKLSSCAAQNRRVVTQILDANEI